MVMHEVEHDALALLRGAIINDVREDMATIDELTEWHGELVAAWNNFANAGVHGGKPITDDDLMGEQR